ncbi:MAG: glutamate 5-kinase [Oscillospiraceae bacterium]|jgi:glutamate 5-kinase|nr:glutamate 5-kinase [Oscillospiraceae bacterium]
MGEIANFRRLVVKVGTSTVTHASGAPNLRRLDRLVCVLSDIKHTGRDVILVTSGAIGVGVSRLGLPGRPSEVRYKQAAAAVGQCQLIHLYDKFFSEYGVTVGQILLSRDDVGEPSRRASLENTFLTLFEWGSVPIVNENDSVSFDEIETGRQRLFGDNDTLSATVAELVNADLLVLLTDIDALYSGDPRTDPDARPIPVVRAVDDALCAAAGSAGSARGTGGMMTKLAAARMALAAGFDMVVASGEDPSILYEIAAGRPAGTLFSRKH